MTLANHHYDVIVIGGGPSGATTATLVAQQGRRVLLLERERFPRFHIGESLMPETYWTFQRLGVLAQLKASDFPKKYSVQFISPSGRESQPFYFFETNSHESSQTWQVPRDEFDRMLLDNARAQGVEVRTGTAAASVIFDGDRAAGVRLGDGAELRARVVVDATGLDGLLSKALGLRIRDPKLRKAAVYAHYQGAHRAAGMDEGATLVIHTPNADGWFWYIPLNKDRVSVGIVSSPETLFGGRKDPLAVLEQEIERCAPVRERVKAAARCLEVRVTSDFSFRSRRIAGDGWVLVGDAFGFLDPIYSSGVFLALKSGEMAADAIGRAFSGGDFSAATLGSWAPKFTVGMEAMRKLVYAFYTPGFSFKQFLMAHPQCKKNLVDLLIGDVFKEGITDIFGPMGEMCDLPAPVEA